MKDISQRELRNASAAVMDAVERGEAFRITRHGTVVAELRPVVRGGFVGSATLKAAFASLPAIDVESLRAEADAVFGEDRVGG
ncbi:MAG: PhdYeFM domain-containing protein [Trueperaceae bacterium]|nr:MAG: PhdYeFM domain-containing protein [Trueperaceae bacterium]